jgi:hypothetical protein
VPGVTMTHLSVITNPNAARDDADHTIVIAPEDRTIVVPPEDRTIVVPPRTPDDCVVALPDGRRFWVSLPPDVQALLPRGTGVPAALLARASLSSAACSRARWLTHPRPGGGQA